ncbi:hypothetical protein MB901379_03885 [Mycobacterium basiliense]|uniref:Uncharacterized protein n=1 Tax=Mycobacterium basiliense TaxID=2094119 RepID=A0A3S4CE84_9MYCO|nr:hypothetical protein [Mycobacterium basiliense]VDM90289.1 hypothetical protein MB901379_03885 [Mycobacterium basiliense]
MTGQIGSQYPQPDPRGWLVFESLPPDLQRAEDATQHADYHRTGGHGVQLLYERDTCTWYFERTATDTERTLLEHLGYALPDDLTTRVSYASETLRCRTWPQLEETTP